MTNQEMYDVFKDKAVDLLVLLIPNSEDRAEFNPACFEYDTFGSRAYWRGAVDMPTIEEFYNKYLEIYGV